jgi:hypothetical protein
MEKLDIYLHWYSILGPYLLLVPSTGLYTYFDYCQVTKNHALFSAEQHVAFCKI